MPPERSCYPLSRAASLGYPTKFVHFGGANAGASVGLITVEEALVSTGLGPIAAEVADPAEGIGSVSHPEANAISGRSTEMSRRRVVTQKL
jgi:hypothetical protein